MTHRARGLLAAVASFFRQRSAPDAPIRRGPSPASVGLDDDPIVAALVTRDGAKRNHRGAIPPGDAPP